MVLLLKEYHYINYLMSIKLAYCQLGMRLDKQAHVEHDMGIFKLQLQLKCS